jgi:hypothetical protein
LIGVGENSIDGTGILVGVEPNSHPDSADLYGKVKYLLNKTPTFSYAVVNVMGNSVGVIEILPGGRPFYPLKDKGQRLMRYRALMRRGSSTDAASPDEIQAWAWEDRQTAITLTLVQEELLAFLAGTTVKYEDNFIFYPEYLQRYIRKYQKAIDEMNYFTLEENKVRIPNDEIDHLAFYALTRPSLLKNLNLGNLERLYSDPFCAQTKAELHGSVRRTLKAIRAVTSDEFIKRREEQNIEIQSMLFKTKGRGKEILLVNLAVILGDGNRLLNAIYEAKNLFNHIHSGTPLDPQPASLIPRNIINSRVEDPINEELSLDEVIRFVSDPDKRKQ